MEEVTKPPEMCRDIDSRPARWHLEDLGYRVREANESDLDTIRWFHEKIWPFALTTLETPGQLIRLIEHGLVLILEDRGGALVGVNVNEHWADGTQYGVRNTIDPGHSRQRLGALLPLLAAEIGRDRGLRVRRAIVSPLNPAGATNLLNHIGFVADGFRLTYPGETRPEFLVSLPLDQLYHTQIDPERLKVYSAEHPSRVRLSPRLDAHLLAAVYRETEWRVVAALPDTFVAVQ